MHCKFKSRFVLYDETQNRLNVKYRCNESERVREKLSSRIGYLFEYLRADEVTIGFFVCLSAVSVALQILAGILNLVESLR